MRNEANSGWRQENFGLWVCEARISSIVEVDLLHGLSDLTTPSVNV